MGKHDFNFTGGEDLRHMAAGWFVSYCFYLNIDKTHNNWNLVDSTLRKTWYEKSKKNHRDLLAEILKMSDSKLSTNEINLSSSCIKKMASDLLQKTTLK